MPSNITLEDVNSEKAFSNVEYVVDIAYDEAGNRLWYSVDNRVRNEKWTEVTLAGVGVFKSQDADAANPTYNFVRQDLVAGAYRDASGKAHFPVLDAQGSVRGYVTKSGLESAYDYYPYGTVVEVSPNAGDDNKRWQDKEFDNEHGKYYFGSRYFDPFFGMWISPDPAGQFANPYSYGGDPLNYIDPTGMWALGLGLVVGYDSNHGWSFGVGAAAEIGDVGFNASLAFNQDGSKSLNLGANASIPVFNTGWWINAGTGFNLNSYMGASLSYSAGACYGASTVACAGVEVGQSFSWNSQNGFGMSVYVEAYATFAGVRTSVGGEAGFFGAEGRGFYAGISGYGLHAQVAQNGGFDWGWSHRFDIGGYDSEKGWYFSNTAKIIGGLFALDMNQSILGMSWQLISRFTWESIQTVVGLVAGIVASEMGIVDNVSYQYGNTILRYKSWWNKGAFTLGSFISGEGLYASVEEAEKNGYCGRPLLPHETGHVIQSKVFGFAYPFFFAIPSLISATWENMAPFFGKKYDHMDFAVEKEATMLGEKFYGIR